MMIYAKLSLVAHKKTTHLPSGFGVVGSIRLTIEFCDFFRLSLRFFPPSTITFPLCEGNKLIADR